MLEPRGKPRPTTTTRRTWREVRQYPSRPVLDSSPCPVAYLRGSDELHPRYYATPRVGKALWDCSIPHHTEDIGPVAGSPRMDMTTKSRTVLGHDYTAEGLFIDVSVAKPVAVRHRVSSARRGGHAVCTAKKHKEEQNVLIIFWFATYSLTTLEFSTGGDICEDTISFYREVATHWVLNIGCLETGNLAPARGQEMVSFDGDFPSGCNELSPSEPTSMWPAPSDRQTDLPAA